MSEATEYGDTDPIAVIGMAGRFPQAPSLDQFWENIRDGVVSIRFLSREELLEAGEDRVVLDDPDYVAARAVLEDVDLFDAALFGFTPREARILDPQQRVFLECAWEALEVAGYDASGFNGRIGVFGGVGMNTYLWHNLRGGLLDTPLDDLEARLSNDKDFLTTWISYKFDLTGPSLAVQTACSTSLVAVHAACQSLLSYESDLALAGGVTILLPQVRGYVAKEGGVASRDGRCLPFDARATGTVGGSGAGIVALRRLSDALRAGDSIIAVIRGSAVNNDGGGKVGYTAPSVEGQARVVREALEVAGVEAETIDYVEAHGTGTAIGDPIEIEALTRAYGLNARKRSCAIGSVKANIGHVDAAAGVASLIKVLLALKHRVIPPSAYFEAPNPLIDFSNGPFFVNTDLLRWPENGTVARAGVSSFGMGGTNAHVIVEAAPPAARRTPRDYHLFTVSAKTPEAMNRAASNLAAHLQHTPSTDLGDAAYTTNVGRRELPHRRAAACRTRDEAVELLREPKLRGEATAPARPTLVFMFPGQGDQRVGMARGLYRDIPVFRSELDRCLEELPSTLGGKLRRLLVEDAPSDVGSDELDCTELAQPALLAFEYALARQWEHWGIRADLMIGHSIGEYVAACLAGVFSLEDALRIVAARGRLMQKMAPGAMVAVAGSEEDVAGLLGEKVDLAGVNGPRQVVLAGSLDAMSEVEEALAERGVRSRRLKTSHAFHSVQMEPMMEEFRTELNGTRWGSPKTPFFSNVTGELISAQLAQTSEYWVDHVRAPVRLHRSLDLVSREDPLVCLEIGRGSTLTSLARICFTENSQRALASMPALASAHGGATQLIGSCGELWELGITPDWETLYAGDDRHRTELPTYPFERQRYWVDAPSCAPNSGAAEHNAEEADSLDSPAVPSLDGGEAAEGSPLALVAEVFREAFGIDRVTGDDDFFDLGGNSLVAADVMHRLRRATGLELPVRFLFDAPKVADLAGLIAATDDAMLEIDSLASDLEQLPKAELQAVLAEQAGTEPEGGSRAE